MFRNVFARKNIAANGTVIAFPDWLRYTIKNSNLIKLDL